MVIYVEGPDNVGKGTQISNMVKEFAALGEMSMWWHYSNFGIKDVDECMEYSEDAYWEMFTQANYMNLGGTNIICDRAHLGEWVYGKKYRNYDADFIWKVEEDMIDECEVGGAKWSHNYLLVFIDEPENLIARDDGLSFSTALEDKRWEVDRFVDAFRRSKISNKVLVNISGKTPEKVWSEVKKFLFGE